MGKKINTKIIHLGSDPKIILDQLMILFIKTPLLSLTIMMLI